ncbi:subtilase-type protease inhibitor [Streptomyces sp. NPDC007861]|uniref:subtilase-type protease inhibitor n=1 Tax=Streptomyces sp. NPDC007861 TaxID=3154893 RepID=UPI0033C6AD52
MRYLLTTLGAAASTAALLLTTTGSAQAAAPAAQHVGPAALYAPSALVLTLGHGDEAATATVERAVTLSCAPAPAGSHPSPESACQELAAVDGQFGLLSRTPDGPCTRQWDPVTITATGVWQGKQVGWSATYGNACEMTASLTEGGSVFAF